MQKDNKEDIEDMKLRQDELWQVMKDIFLKNITQIHLMVIIFNIITNVLL